ncbi:MAG: imelysin family protein [Anaerolineae bacterium]|nr:imelysin family protein [Anaerolineae bacterium]
MQHHALIRRTLALLSVTALLIVGSAGAQTDEFSRRDMLENIVQNIILPLHEGFVQQTEAFHDAAEEFVANPRPPALETVREQWRRTSLMWEKVSLFRLGRDIPLLHNRIDNGYPAAPSVIDGLLDGDQPLDADFMETQASNVYNLRAIEYLLFDGDWTPNEAIAAFASGRAGQRRQQYVLTATSMLQQTAADLWQIWSPEGDDYARTFVNLDDLRNPNETISMLTANMLRAIKDIYTTDLALPLGITTGEPDPALVPSPYGDYSLQEMNSLLKIIQQTFNGDSDHGSLGLDDYLDLIGATENGVPLSGEINDQLTAIIAAIDALNYPLSTLIEVQPQRIQSIYGGMEYLVHLFEVDMAGQMGLSIAVPDSGDVD